MKTTKSIGRIFLNIVTDQIRLFYERSKNILGFYNSDTNKKHDYLEKFWFLDQ